MENDMEEELSAVLCLDRAADDALPFSAEYQQELRTYSVQMKARYQRAFTMDGVIGGGGPLGEFIFTNGSALVTGISTVAGAWIGARLGRKVRLKVGDVEVEAKSAEEIKHLLAVAKEFAEKSPSAGSPAPQPPKR